MKIEEYKLWVDMGYDAESNSNKWEEVFFDSEKSMKSFKDFCRFLGIKARKTKPR